MSFGWRCQENRAESNVAILGSILVSVELVDFDHKITKTWTRTMMSSHSPPISIPSSGLMLGNTAMLPNLLGKKLSSLSARVNIVLTNILRRNAGL
ncbi:hypothetical protein I7I48_11311 [Histoplasma ohiense]|nr:hypothetical protein I7I48_11311 [Histoplasma ohiense (nom. inval.)]